MTSVLAVLILQREGEKCRSGIFLKRRSKGICVGHAVRAGPVNQVHEVEESADHLSPFMQEKESRLRHSAFFCVDYHPLSDSSISFDLYKHDLVSLA